MTTRLNAYAVAPQGVQKMIELEEILKNSGLEYSLYELVKMRASQINGCAFCLHMHSKDARAAGETEERLHLLVAWRESSLYTPRERAALAWTESLTNLAQTGAPDADYDGLKEHFTEVEIVNLTLLIGLINSWNRMAVGLRSQHPKPWSAAAKAA
jgi:AhpD family alkylhydroperoxidase